MQDTKSIHKKPVVFLYINIKQSEKEIKKTIPFTIASTRIKYLVISLIKQVKDLYTENYKTWMKEIEEDTKNEKIVCVNGLKE